MPEARPPLVGGELWAAVVDRAGSRCQCTGECGRPHREGGERRCQRADNQRGPLHVVPAKPTSTHAAAGLAAVDLIAVCASCHTGIVRTQRRQQAQRAEEPTAPPF